MSAVIVVVHRIGVAVGDVDAVAIVRVAVAVLVGAVGRALAGIVENVTREIGMIVIEAGVENRHHHAAAARGVVPGGGGADLGQSIEAAEARIVGRGGQTRFRVEVQNVVGLGIEDLGILPVLLEGVLDRNVGRQLDHFQAVKFLE